MRKLYNYLHHKNVKLVLQVGDFGYWENYNRFPHLVSQLSTKYGITTIFIEGNHDKLDKLCPLKQLTEIEPNLFYAPRYTTLTLGDKNILFIGGASSVYTLPSDYGKWWFPELEMLSENMSNKFMRENQDMRIDVMICHDAPTNPKLDSILRPKSGSLKMVERMKSIENRRRLKKLHDFFGCPKLYHGHYHTHYQYETITGLNMDGSNFRDTNNLPVEHCVITTIGEL